MLFPHEKAADTTTLLHLFHLPTGSAYAAADYLAML